MADFIIGTAGHIDHGKTTLVKALTGVDTDQLPAEIERGMTIEPGFTAFVLPGGRSCSVIDLPGHERFVHHVSAQSSSLDLALLVISAKEGVKPQTEEHVDLLKIVGVKKILSVLTHADLVSESEQTLRITQVLDFLQSKGVHSPEVVACDALSGKGVAKLKERIEQKLLATEKSEEEEGAEIFRIPIDRAFVLKGIGTVVTGTLISGQISEGNWVCLYPSKNKFLVRKIEIHGEEVKKVKGKKRVALNLTGEHIQKVRRGEVLAPVEGIILSDQIVAKIDFLSSQTNRESSSLSCQFQSGVSRITCKVSFSKGYARIKLSSPILILRKDRFILRAFQPIKNFGATLGGGTVADIAPARGGTILKTLEDEEALVFFIQREKGGIILHELAFIANLAEKNLEERLNALIAQGKCVLLRGGREKAYIHVAWETFWKEKVLGHLKDFHQTFPLRSGIKISELTTKCASTLPQTVWQHLLERLVQGKQINIANAEVSLTSFAPHPSDKECELKEKIYAHIREANFIPPPMPEICSRLKEEESKILELAHLLLKEGRLIKVKEHLFYSKDAIEKIKKLLAESHEPITPHAFRSLTGLSRKFMIPLLEYFDRIKFTIRIGDIRTLQKPKSQEGERHAC